MTLAELVRTTAAAAGLPCHLIPLPDFVAAAQGIVMDFLPGKPFSYDNYKSLTIDSVCTQDGCASLGIRPVHMQGIIAGYLRDYSLQKRLDAYRRSIPD
jgi:NADH dehydrogenase